MSVKNNKNASKGHDGHLTIRCPVADKASWDKKSKAKKMNLTEWVIKNLNKAD